MTSLGSVRLAEFLGFNAFIEHGTFISIEGKRLSIVSECTSLSYILIFASAVIAYPASSLSPPRPSGERIEPALSTVEGVRVGRLRFPHLPIHLFTGLMFFALLTAALPAWAAAKTEDVENKSCLRFEGGLDASKIYAGHRFETAGWMDLLMMFFLLSKINGPAYG